MPEENVTETSIADIQLLDPFGISLQRLSAICRNRMVTLLFSGVDCLRCCFFRSIDSLRFRRATHLLPPGFAEFIPAISTIQSASSWRRSANLLPVRYTAYSSQRPVIFTELTHA